MIKDFAMSIMGVKNYEKLVNNPLWKAVLYLSIISLLFGSIIAMSFVNRYTKIITLIPQVFDTEVPDFIIENGEMKLVNGEKKVIEKEGVALIFDDNSNADRQQLDNYEKGILLLRDEFTVKTSKYGYMTRKWAELVTGRIDRNNVRESLGMIPGFFTMLMIGIVLLFLALNSLMSILVTFAALIFKRLWSKELSFSEAFKMALYSLTLPVLLVTAGASLIGERLTLTRYFNFYYIAVIYVIGALRRRDTKLV